MNSVTVRRPVTQLTVVRRAGNLNHHRRIRTSVGIFLGPSCDLTNDLIQMSRGQNPSCSFIEFAGRSRHDWIVQKIRSMFLNGPLCKKLNAAQKRGDHRQNSPGQDAQVAQQLDKGVAAFFNHIIQAVLRTLKYQDLSWQPFGAVKCSRVGPRF